MRNLKNEPEKVFGAIINNGHSSVKKVKRIPTNEKYIYSETIEDSESVSGSDYRLTHHKSNLPK